MEIQDKMIDATKEIFSTMIMMEITLEETDETHGSLTDNITAMIGLAGTHKGVLGSAFPLCSCLGNYFQLSYDGSYRN